MLQTIEGDTAARRVETVLKFCSGHKRLESRRNFDRSRTRRGDGLQTRCRVSNRAGWRPAGRRQHVSPQ